MSNEDGTEIAESAIAIVGMAARLPGARNVGEFWQNLRNGVESVRTYTDEELLAHGESPEALRRPNYVRAGAPLSDMEMFDAEFFGFSPKDAAIMDPQHRHFLEVAWEALENAGHPPEKFQGPVGVWSGCGPNYYFAFNLCSHPELIRDVGLFLLRHTGNDKDFLPTRVSYLLDLTGPSIAVQTACSSSLTAVHLACQSLLNREVDMALAGGVTIELPHRRGYLHHEGEVLSPDGHCHAFDHRGQGTVFGSGAGVVVLRRLEDAITDRDHIYAVVLGSAVNNDGSTKVNYLAPSVDGQARCMVEAYGMAGIGPETIDYIECHGTGTYLGDPIEIAALTRAFREMGDASSKSQTGWCRIGSVKTSIGHLDNAAGVASLIKGALALHHQQIPASLNFEKPNPSIDFRTSPFLVNDRLSEWKAKAHPRRAAVNALGVGGTNAHVVIEEAPPRATSSAAKRPYQLLMLSGRTQGALEDNARRLREYLEHNPDTHLADVAYTLHHGRREFDRRRVLAAADTQEAVRLLSESDPRRVFADLRSSKPSIVFAFPGGGAQYAGMAAGLYRTEPVFAKEIDRGLVLLLRKHGIDLRPLLFASDLDAAAKHAELEPMPLQLPAIFLIEWAMAALLESWGIRPDILVGHSLGENTAAAVAGVMSFEDALGLVVLRGALFAKVQGGGMLSVALTRHALEPLLPSELDVAVINVPDVTVVSGPLRAIEVLEARLSEREVEHKRLAIPVAAHSRMLEPILAEFRSYLRSISLSRPKIPFLSNRNGKPISDSDATDPEYWVAHLRSSVDFSACLETLFATPDRIFLEVGPGRTLSSLAKQHPAAAGARVHPVVTLRHRDEQIDDSAFFLTQLGRLWAAGAAFDFEKLWAGEVRNRIPLPTYAFQHQPYFIEPAKVQVVEEDLSDLPKIADVSEWGWRPVFSPRLARASESHGPETWLLFADAVGLAKRVREKLLARGHTVITVYEGDGFTQRSDTEYALAPERGREGYSALLAQLLKHGHAPTRIAHFWMVTQGETFRAGSSFFHRNQERGFYSLLFLAQAIADEGLQPPVHISAVVNGMARVGDELVAYPEKATLLGPIKVIPRELAGITCSAVDVRLPETSSRLWGGNLLYGLVDPFAGKKSAQSELDRLAEHIEHELGSAPRNAVVALRDAQRYELGYEPQRIPAALSKPMREGGVVVVTGGLGGLGLAFAHHLAEAHKAKLALIGRSSLPERDQWDAHLRTYGNADRTSERIREIRALEKKGAQVLLLTADVTIESELRDAIASVKQRWGRIDGVIHAAGVVRDALIAQKTQGQCEDVFTPKIHGTLVLDRVLEGVPLDFVVLFSSTSSVIAPPGQVDYVAANAFLNAFADRKRSLGRPYTAIAWGIFSELGMAHDALFRNEREAEVRVVGQVGSALFDARIEQQGKSALIARLHPATHWFLDEHRTASGHAVVPGTGYLELLREALVEEGETGPFVVHDLVFIRPLAVAEDEIKEVRVRIEPSASGYSFEVRSQIEIDGRRAWELHAQARVTLAHLATPRPLSLQGIESRCSLRREADPSGITTPQEKFLRFGPRWRVLREVRWGQGEAIADLELTSHFAEELDQFGLHPALLDIATGFAMDLVPGYDAKTLWVPINYETVRVHSPLVPRVRSWVRWTGGNASDPDVGTFDVTLTDPEGNVLLEVERFSIRRTQGSLDFGTRSVPAPSELEFERNGRERSPAEEQLARNLERGISPREGAMMLDRVLANLPQSEIVVSSMELPKLIAQTERATVERQKDESGTKFARPDLPSEYVAPRDDIERTLVGFFEDLLGVQMVGVLDSFFDLGGHSLIAVRLFAKIKKTYAVDLPISALFEAPTAARVAAMIRERIGSSKDSEAGGANVVELPRARYAHLVPMHPGDRQGGLDSNEKTPFFIVAGMFGNVLNLRHLAHLIGSDRRFYGLQARGLYGDSQPHETIEDMAQAYLRELRQVQPHGPYMLGGFSGGGITAYEMAQHLRADGEEVALLLMLDTPLPHRPPLATRDRALMQWVSLKSKGAGYMAEWARARLDWELGKLKKRFDEPEPDRAGDEFKSAEVGEAFRRAIARYELQPYVGKVTLFRPKLVPMWRLPNGKLIDKERHYMQGDNGWTPWVDALEVVEVPGDHDSMVLEPNVRVVAQHLRRCIESALPKEGRPKRIASPAAIALSAARFELEETTSAAEE